MKKIVFMGAKEIGFKCLSYLYENKRELGVEIVGVLTNQRGDKIKEYCEKTDLNLIQSLDEYLKIQDFDILISVQYHLILKEKHIQKAKEIAVNLHMAPLPEYRGCNQFSFAIINNDNAFGTTIHRLETGIDSGDIIFQKRFPIPKNCWVDNLVSLTNKHSFELFKDNIENLILGNYKLIKQKEIGFVKSEFHLRKEINTIKQINIDSSFENISKSLRATYMPDFEPPFFMLDGEKIYFLKEKEYKKLKNK